MRYLVTGGRGVIGSLFARRLVAEGHSVAIIDDGTDRRHDANTFEGPSYHAERLERMSLDRLTALVASSDRVFHAAASTGIPYSAEQPLDDWRRNVDGTLALLEALRREPRPTVVLSSVKPYNLDIGDGLTVGGYGVNEEFGLLPDEPYAASKAAQSLICQAYARSYGLPITIFRCSNLCGPAAPHGARHGFFTWLCIQAALGMPIEIQGTGEQRRDILHAYDVADAALAAYRYTLCGEIFNLGGGHPNVISVLGLVAMLRSLGADITTTYADGRKHEDQLFVTDHSKASSLLAWSPKIPVDTAAGAIYEWACNNREMLRRVYG